MKILSSMLFVGALAFSAQGVAGGDHMQEARVHGGTNYHYGHHHGQKRCHQHCNHNMKSGKFYIEAPIGEDQARALQRLRDKK